MEKGAFEISLEGRLGLYWSKLDRKGIVERGKIKHEARRHGPRAVVGNGTSSTQGSQLVLEGRAIWWEICSF